MTNQEIDIAVHEALGWQRKPDGKKWRSLYARAYYTWAKPFGDGSCWYLNQVPPYTSNLDVMHSVEGTLTAEQKRAYLGHLAAVTGWDKEIELYGKDGHFTDDAVAWLWSSAHATAAQRAEAFLKAVNRWVSP